MRTQDVVTISREWNNPQIHITVDVYGIALQMGMGDFIAALVEEMGNPTLLVSKAQLAAKPDLAKQAVIEKVKAESVKVM